MQGSWDYPQKLFVSSSLVENFVGPFKAVVADAQVVEFAFWEGLRDDQNHPGDRSGAEETDTERMWFGMPG
jgi:hypothetical protein